jgi:hypothetical protein
LPCHHIDYWNVLICSCQVDPFLYFISYHQTVIDHV